MSFSLGSIAGAIVNPIASITGSLLGGAVPQRPDAPNLPGAPTLQAPTLPQYPGFNPQQQQLLQQQQNYLQQLQGLVGGYGGGAYDQGSNAAGQQELQNYQNALQGRNPPNQALEQQKARDWAQTVEQAGQQGIRLSGDTPEGAVSQSTAGNQLIRDFNQRYGVLEQQYNLGQQQFGQQANMQRLGLGLGQYEVQLGGYGQLGTQAQQLFNPYQQQQMGQFGQQTQQVLSNTDIANQNRLNAYQQATGQTMTNYNNALAGYQSNMGLLGGALGLGAQILSRGMAGGGSTPQTPQTIPYGGNNGMGFGNPLSLYNGGGMGSYGGGRNQMYALGGGGL